MMTTSERFFVGGALFIVLLLIGMMGKMDMDDEIAEQEFYCEQVLAGHWPDYKHTADEVCDAS
jgi:hypothetical protein